MTKEKTPNYTAAQEALISTAAASGPLNLDAAKVLAANPAMNTADGQPRNYKSIIAKISRMGLPYARKQPTTKDGRAVVKKSDLVAQIAELAGITAFKLEGMDASPKASLEAIVSALENRVTFEMEVEAEAA